MPLGSFWCFGSQVAKPAIQVDLRGEIFSSK